MRLTKRQLKRIIREEYTRLKRRGLIKEVFGPVKGDPVYTAAQQCLADCSQETISFIAYCDKGIELLDKFQASDCSEDVEMDLMDCMEVLEMDMGHDPKIACQALVNVVHEMDGVSV